MLAQRRLPLLYFAPRRDATLDPAEPGRNPVFFESISGAEVFPATTAHVLLLADTWTSGRNSQNPVHGSRTTACNNIDPIPLDRYAQ